MKKNWILAIFALILIINVSSVMAADFLSPIMNVFKGLDIGRYVNDSRYYPFIDAVIYFVLFIGISMWALGKVFGDNKLLPITIGVILALAMTGFEYTTKWRLIVALSMYAFILAMLIVGFFLYYVMNKLTGHFWVPFFITVFLIVGLIGTNAKVREQVQQYETLEAGIGFLQAVAVIGLIPSAISMFKRRGDGPSSSEISDLKTYFPSGTGAASTIQDVDTEIQKTTKDKGEKELLEEAKEETKLEEDSEVPIAEAKKTVDELEAEKKFEEMKNINEEKIMGKLIGDSDMINNIMNRVGDPNADAVMHDYIKKYLKEVSNVGIALEQNQKNTIKARLELLNNILENAKKVEDILKRTKRAEHYISYIEKKVTKDMGQEVLKHMDKALDDLKRAKINSNKGWDEQIMTAKAAKNVFAMNELKKNKIETANKIDANIRLLSINKAKIKSSIDIFIKQYIGAVDKTISEIKKIVSDQITFQQDLNKKINNAFNDAKLYYKYIKDLEGAVDKIGGVSYRVENEDTAGVEELIMKSQIAIEGMFLQVSNINNLTIKLFREDIKAILDDFQKLDIQSSELGNAIDKLTKSSEQVEQQYENLKKSASFNKTGQSENIAKILRAIDTMSKTSSQERQQVINQTINQINKIEADLNNELTKMIQENQRLKNTQDKVINSLKRALDTLTKVRTRETTRIEQAANKMDTVAAQQAQNLNTVYQGLESANFKK